jgi:FMN-dependent NADH-azoreductase
MQIKSLSKVLKLIKQNRNMSSYLLHIDVSPNGARSNSKPIGATFVASYLTAHPNEKVTTRDLAKDPLPHMDAEILSANYMPEAARSETQQARHVARLEIVREIVEAKAIVISTPMWNWTVPSVLKAYIDHIIVVGQLDAYTKRLLAGKPVTIIISSGSAYGADSAHPEFDHETPILKHIFTSLGATDIEFIYVAHTMAGVYPGMEALIPAKEASKANALIAADVRARAI